MALILTIETSTKVCSVCLSQDGLHIAAKELYEANSHATHLTVFIDELFEKTKFALNDLDAIAVSSGPGSYTGLRIGVSVAKGLCYGLNIPLIAITSLEALAYAGLKCEEIEEVANDKMLFCPMIDARRMEVYTTLYDSHMNRVTPITAEIIDETSFQKELASHKIIFLGDGAEKCKEFITGPNAIFVANKAPLASNMVAVSFKKFTAKQFEDVAYFEPFYLKDFVATTPKKKIL